MPQQCPSYIASIPCAASPWVFEDLIAPLGRETFLLNYLDQKPFFGKALNQERFNTLMSWEVLNDLLSIVQLWTPQTLQLVLDGNLLEPGRYCKVVTTQSGQAYRPQNQQVMAFLQQGASLVCNEIDGLTPALRAMNHVLQKTFGAKIQANLYLSWGQKQAFKSHFDTHDVWAFHILGEKKWHIYEGRYEAPLPHPAFKQLGQAYHDQAKGEIALEVTLAPGDMLYLPRGTYHDALASSEVSLHVTFGVSRPVGLDVLSLLFEKAVQIPFFRKNVPASELFQYMKHFEKACSSLLSTPEFRETLSHFQQHFSYEQQDYDLPHGLSSKKAIKKSTS